MMNVSYHLVFTIYCEFKKYRFAFLAIAPFVRLQGFTKLQEPF